jgi:hypothetical protein
MDIHDFPVDDESIEADSASGKHGNDFRLFE